VLRVPEAGQVAKGAHVSKIDLRRLDQALPHVGEVRPQDDHLKGGLQDPQPSFSGVEGDAEIPGRSGQVEELSAPGGQGPEKILEEIQVADLS
jgi:hypothetical protein